MRHLVGLILGIVLSPLLFIAVAWSAWRQQVRVGTGRIFTSNLTVELLLLVVCLVIIGVIVAGRVSPLVAFLVGVPFLLDACLGIFSPKSLLDLTDHNNSIARGTFTIGIDNVALAIGLMCMIPMLVRSRWPKWRPVAAAPLPAHSATTSGPTTGDTRPIDVREPYAAPTYVPPGAPDAPPEAPRG